MAACFASKGYKVIGVDVNLDTIEAVNKRRCSIYEPGLAKLIRECHDRLSATNNYKYAVENSEITFVVVPTPSEEDGSFSIKYVEAALVNIATALESKKTFHLVVLTSTVLPGVTENIVKPLIEKISRKECAVDFGLCYNPEFIALGSVIRDFLNPDVVLIGESDTKSGKILAEIYKRICGSGQTILKTTIYNAELAKISFNAFVTMKISFANTLAEICERIPGGNVDMVAQVLGSDSRIGRKCLSGGLAYGGPCFPRDNRAFSSVAEKVGCRARLSEAADEVNRGQIDRIINLVRQKLDEVKDKNIAILGLTYKPNTDIVEESASMKIAGALLEEGACLSVYDPAGKENARGILGENVKYANSMKECLEGVEFCIIATPWEEFKRLGVDNFAIDAKAKPQRLKILDCWRILGHLRNNKKIEYHAIGLNNLAH